MNLVSTGARKDGMKGFTLIELLVVIAIIGILSAVVLASLSTARSKGQDAKIQEQLSGMRAAAEIYYGGSNSYDTAGNCSVKMFADSNSGMSGIIAGTTNIHCGSNGTAWAASAPLVSTTSSWCVDSTGASHYVVTQTLNGVNVCPAS